jgi:CO dehydrogenase/acetyl-CoA synthase alpha subunit
MNDTTPREKALARHLCREILNKAGEELFRKGTLKPGQEAEAAAVTERIVERLWPSYLQEARGILAGDGGAS